MSGTESLEHSLRKKIQEDYKSGNWKDILSAAFQLKKNQIPGHLVSIIVEAALKFGDRGILKNVVRLTVECKSEPHQRAQQARLLAHWGRNTDALLVLFSDPFLEWGEEKFALMMSVVGPISRCIDHDDIAVITAKTLVRHLESKQIDKASTPKLLRPTPSSLNRSWRRQSEVQCLLGQPAIILNSPNVEPQTVDMVKRGVQHSDKSLEKSLVPDIWELNDVFLHEDGTIWSAAGEIFRKCGNRDYPQESELKGIPRFDILIGACHHTNHNPYHWFVDMMPALGWRLDMRNSTIPIGIANHARSWAEESIQLAAEEPVPVARISGTVYVKRLLLPRGGVQLLAFPHLYERAFARLLSKLQPSEGIEAERPIYVSRRDATRRAMRNEELLEERLNKLGVHTVLLSRLTLKEKISAFRHSPMIIGAHGAGLAYSTFAPPGRKILEILPVKDGGFDNIKLCMTRISKVVGHRHFVYLAHPKLVDKSHSWELSIDHFLQSVDAVSKC
jgi:hypothetical protein